MKSSVDFSSIRAVSFLVSSWIIISSLFWSRDVGEAMNTSKKWPVIVSNSEVQDFYHCIYVFFICTDYVGKWPNNQETCNKYYDRCIYLVEFSENKHLKGDHDDLESNEISTGQAFNNPSPEVSTGGAETPASQSTSIDDNHLDASSSNGTDGPQYEPVESGTVDINHPTIPDQGRDYPRTCYELLKAYRSTQTRDSSSSGKPKSGVYQLQTGDGKVKNVYCDMETRGGGWTVIQRRGQFGNPISYFFRKWDDYKIGFGDPNKDHWLGLEAIHYILRRKDEEVDATTAAANAGGGGGVEAGDSLKQRGPFQLMVELETFDSNSTSLIVNDFRVGNASEFYPIFYKNYNSKIGNSLPARGTKFSTIDRDNDAWKNNCAERFSGAWWFTACHNSNINGLYLGGPHKSFGNGVNWYHFSGYNYSLKRTVMKVRERAALLEFQEKQKVPPPSI